VRPDDKPASGVPQPSGMAKPSYDQAPMVGWYRPVQLARTAVSVATSTIFGRHSDHRLVEALAAEPSEYFDYSLADDGAARNDLWIDYAADSGDGFNSTYSSARAVARKLTLRWGNTEHQTERGRILVLGGDLTYPVAARQQYEQRLVMPFELALPQSTAPHPDLFTVPGNHDWYDSLVAFTRRFCSMRWFAGWRTHQHRSYFALKLPHDWWLLGTDVQLDSDIDSAQVAYFKKIAALMTPGARVILCNAEPHWIYDKKYGAEDEQYTDSNLRFLEERVLGRRIFVFLAGDLHHYRRHTDGTRHKIVAGGGGAFMHPTHDQDVASLRGSRPNEGEPAPPPYQLITSYPTPQRSRRLTWRNLLFPFLNWKFGLVTGLLYLLTCRSLQVDLSSYGIRDFGAALKQVIGAAVREPTALLWISLVFTALVLFTDTHPRWYRRIAGTLHGLAHLTAAFFIGWGAAWATVHLHTDKVLELVLTGLLVFVGGALAGPLVMGTYLLVSLNVFGRHANEAFSSLAIPDFKNFLRLHIGSDGSLRIYPIKIERVARRWRAKPSAGPHEPQYEPDDRRASAEELIEEPITVTGGRK
jgi:hypothetical protein